jgi:allophanate hydrolase
MTITVIKPGLQTTIQAGPRVGMRHFGVPASGAADTLSLALGNRLVGNALLAPAVEASMAGVSLRFDSNTSFALTGAPASADLNGRELMFHTTLAAGAGDELHIGPTRAGAHVYITVAGGFVVDEILGSASTYLPAAFGGHEGRALREGDRITVGQNSGMPTEHETPSEFRPPISRTWALRACRASEFALLDDSGQKSLFDTNYTIGQRADRMGMQLEGANFCVSSDGRMTSAPVFPGTIQCPEDGRLFILSADAQTTGGYPRVAQIARADRHMLGQLRPGDHVRLLWRDTRSATDELRAKHDYWREWLPDIARVV